MLAQFARDVFEAAFGEQNDPDHLAAHLGATFGHDQQARELADPAWTTLLAELDGDLVAYAQLRAAPAPAGVQGANQIELVRFYLDRSQHGSGLADRLMDDVLDAAGSREAGTIWLSVWQVNTRAIRFYDRHLFRIVGEKAFMVGEDVQTDWVMSRELPGRPSYRDSK